MPKGKILGVEDGGTVWTIFYRPKGGHISQVVFDWRQLSHFYEGTSGRSFYKDYDFGAGRDAIKKHFIGKTLLVEGEEWEERVGLEG